MLQFATIGSGIGMLGGGISAGSGPDRSDLGTVDDDGVSLGSFETDLEGWKTTGGNELSLVSEEDVPTGVVTGSNGLEIRINGDMYPMIENTERVQEADFLANPYLSFHVVGNAHETGSDLVFQILLRHTQGGGNPGNGGPGNGNGGSNGKGNVGRGSLGNKSQNVTESELFVVPQYTPRRIEWDMTGLPDQALETANRVEIIWYLEDYEPDGGHRGRYNGEFEYEGKMVIDDIRLTDSQQVDDARREKAKRRTLHRRHGMIVDVEIEERSEGHEHGTLVFVDGTEVSFEYERLDDDRERMTLDGEHFEYKLGDGE